MTPRATQKDNGAALRPLWKRGSYWLVLIVIVLVVLLTGYLVRAICEPAPISFECMTGMLD